MKALCISLTIVAVALFPALAQNPAKPFTGRWDMSVTIGNSLCLSEISI